MLKSFAEWQRQFCRLNNNARKQETANRATVKIITANKKAATVTTVDVVSLGCSGLMKQPKRI